PHGTGRTVTHEQNMKRPARWKGEKAPAGHDKEVTMPEPAGLEAAEGRRCLAAEAVATDTHGWSARREGRNSKPRDYPGKPAARSRPTQLPPHPPASERKTRSWHDRHTSHAPEFWLRRTNVWRRVINPVRWAKRLISAQSVRLA